MSFRGRLFLLVLLSGGLLPAFEVTRNVNSGVPLVERVLLFAKDRPHEHIVFGGKGTGQLSWAADGAIVSTIAGSGDAAPRIAWKAGDGRPAAVDLGAYTFLVVTCRLEGTMKETNPRGQVSEKRADNLWFGINLYNAGGERIGGVSIADINEAHEGVTPAETTVLCIPLVLLQGSPLEDRKAAAIGTDWGPTRANQSRDFRWVIDRIALAD